jgi:hypothetical protein
MQGTVKIALLTATGIATFFPVRICFRYPSLGYKMRKKKQFITLIGYIIQCTILHLAQS